MRSISITIDPCDPLNPGFGYEVLIHSHRSSPALTLFKGTSHPITKEKFTLTSATLFVATLFSTEEIK